MHAFRPSRRRVNKALISLPAWASLPAMAAPGYPGKPINVVVSLQAGSGSDLASRRVSEFMSGNLNTPMVVENAPGAGGVVGASKLFNAQPDGHMIGALNNGLICIVPNLKNKPAFDIEKLTPIGMVAWLPSVLVANASLPVKTLADLTALSRSKPNSMSYGSVGVGSPQHLGMEMLKRSTGLDLMHVPYRGGPQSVADVVAGQIAATWISIPVAASFIKSGQLKAIAVGGTARSDALPDVPTLAESGVTDFTYLPWIGFFAPPALPESIASRLHGELQKALKDSAVSTALANAGLEAAPMGAAEFAQRCETERREMAEVINRLDLA